MSTLREILCLLLSWVLRGLKVSLREIELTVKV